MTSRLGELLNPRSIALVGCPGDLTRPGARPVVYLRRHGYPGNVYPVNPRHAEIGGYKAYPSLAALPERPEVVWIGVPGPQVLETLEEAARLAIPSAVILTAGFSESDAAGRHLQARLREIADGARIAVLGPNMLGFINCWDRVPLTFSPAGGLEPLVPGALGVASQSGALGGIVVNRAFDRNIGVSAMISTGNEAGITVSECLEYFAEDSRTHAVALLAEGIRDGARFKAAALRCMQAGTPIVALKMGRSATGRRNALTHTGALAGSHQAWQAVARQLGIVEVDALEDLVDVAGYLSRERRAPRRVAVVATSGGASIMTVDQLEARGIALPRLSARAVEALGSLLPAYARTRDNPVDVTAGLSEDLFTRVLETLVSDPGVDGVVTMVTGARGVERARNVARVARAAPKPVVTCWLGGSLTEEGRVLLDAQGVACFRNPRTLAVALAAARDFAAARSAWRTRRPIRARFRACLEGAAPGPLPYRTLAAPARRAGVPLVAEALVRTPEGAARAARRLGCPVALKVIAPDLPHKTEARALALGLRTTGEVRAAGARLLRRVRPARIEGLLVQRMMEGGEVLVGVTRDRTFGLLLVVGAGGVEAELLADTACRPLPVSRSEIVRALGEVRTLRGLRGHRGAPPADLPALVAAIAAVTRLAESLGDRLASLDVNPIVVGRSGRGAVAVDLLAVLADSAPAE